jgi:ribonuclease PH
MDLDIGNISIGADVEATRLNVSRFAKTIRYAALAGKYRKGKFGTLPKRRRMETEQSRKILSQLQKSLIKRSIRSIDASTFSKAYCSDLQTNQRPSLKYLTIPQ